MAVNVETLEKLERRITLTLAASEINSEVEARLKKLARTVKADGFRPGKVPMSVVAQRYGYSVQYEVVNDKLGQAFASAANEAQLRVAGMPRIEQKQEAPEGQMAFDATFEVYPEVKIGDLSAVELERVSSEVNDAAIDRTVAPGGFLARNLTDAEGMSKRADLPATTKDEIQIFIDTMKAKDALRPDIALTKTQTMTIAGRALEVHVTTDAVTDADVWLFDPQSKVAVLRGDVVPEGKYAGRRVFNAGINLTHLYYGRIPFLWFLVRDLGFVNKMLRGLARPDVLLDDPG